MIEIFIVIKEGIDRYYLLKVMRRGFDVYCIPPHLGVHYSLHGSGESHFRYEENAAKTGEEPPLALVMGEIGHPLPKALYDRLLVIRVELLVFVLQSSQLAH